MSFRICGIADEGARELPDQLMLHRRIGLAGIELRTVSGRLLHQVDDAAFVEVVRQVEDAGLEVPVVDTPIGNWGATLAAPIEDDLALLRRYAGLSRQLGCSRLRIMSYPNDDGRAEGGWRQASLERVGRLVDVAEREGMTLLHENCVGWASREAESTLAMLRTVDDEHLRLVFDTGNGLAYGYDGYDFLQRVLPWVDHVHVKDGIATGDGVRWLRPGDGHVRLAEMLDLLRAHGYAGWLSLEPHIAHQPHTSTSADDVWLGETYTACARSLDSLLALCAR